jgi:hypothetical protein
MEKVTTIIIGKLCEQLHPEARSTSEAIDLTNERVKLVIEIKKQFNIDAREETELMAALETASEECYAESLEGKAS